MFLGGDTTFSSYTGRDWSEMHAQGAIDRVREAGILGIVRLALFCSLNGYFAARHA